MAGRKKVVHGRNVGLTVEQWSEDDTQFPGAWTEALKLLNDFKPERVIGFRLKVYLAEIEKTKDSTK